MSLNLKPFKINVSQSVLNDLTQRLARTRFPDEVEGANWNYGANLGYMKSLTDYWQKGFDWRAQEAVLNQFAHFRTEINGTGLHFIHERGKGPNPTPLLLLHGWPDSFYRFYKLIPMLTDPARFGGDPNHSFDVIVPSLLGFGFSDQPRTREGVDMAEMMLQLMTEGLGYTQFGVHGGDTGSPLAKEIATRYPESVVGIHLTDIGYDATFGLDPATLSEAEKAYVGQVEQWSYAEGAYYMIQSTKPQTLAYGLTDSPVGMAAWIVQHFYSWSDSDGDIERSFTKDELLTNIMIYWVTETLNSSIRWYYSGGTNWEEPGDGDASGGWGDGSNESGGWGGPQRVEVPVGVALFPKDIPQGERPPRELGERTLNVQRWTHMPRGGHFAALEAPELLANDLRAFFASLGQPSRS